MGLLTRDKLHECLRQQAEGAGKVKLGQICIEQGLIKKKDLQVALAGQRGMECVDLDGLDIAGNVLEVLPAQMAKTFRVVPIAFDSRRNVLTIAMDDPDNFRATDDLATLVGYTVEAKITDTDSLEAALAKYYAEEDSSLNELIGEIESDSTLTEFQGRDQSIDLDELKELAESNPVKKLLNLVLLQAIRDKASDIHFEPFEDEFKMRYRIDGVLYEMVPPPKHIAVALSSRIKVMANLDIAERRLPQDGRIPLVVGGNPVDLRVSVLPTMFGESVVLRVLDRGAVE
ncbi:MAG: pilus assembly protein PilB, partial [Planctomycetota bacterium]